MPQSNSTAICLILLSAASDAHAMHEARVGWTETLLSTICTGACADKRSLCHAIIDAVSFSACMAFQDLTRFSGVHYLFWDA